MEVNTDRMNDFASGRLKLIISGYPNDQKTHNVIHNENVGRNWSI